MIRNRAQIGIEGRTIVEKLVIKPPLRQSPVFQDEACFLYFREGGSILSSATEKVEVKKNESILLKCGSYFADIFRDSGGEVCEVYVIHLFPEILQDIFRDEVPFFVKESSSLNYSRKITHKNIIDHFIESLSFYFENPEVLNPELIYLKLKELVMLLLQTDEAFTIRELYSHLFTPRKASISEVVEAHLYSNLTLDQLATLAGQSLSTFKREFRKHFDDTPANYLRNRRLNKAAELLINSTFTIGEIGDQVGYEDRSYFSRLFLNKFQLSPSDYRKKNQKPAHRPSH